MVITQYVYLVSSLQLTPLDLKGQIHILPAKPVRILKRQKAKTVGLLLRYANFWDIIFLNKEDEPERTVRVKIRN